MTYIAIDTNKKQALLFLEYVKTLPFITVYQEPNITTQKAIAEAKKNKSRKHKDSKSLIAFLNK